MSKLHKKITSDKKNDKWYIVAVTTGTKQSFYQFKTKKDVKGFEDDIRKNYPDADVIHTKYKKIIR